jgi:ketosteroid isomerase-like protein
MVARTARQAIEAYNRRDLEAVVIGYNPDFEWVPDPNWVAAGLMEPSYRGLEGYRRYVAGTAEVFGGDVVVEPTEVIDSGDRIVLLARVPMRAQTSGVALTEEWALILRVEDGRIVRLEERYDRAEALRAAGVGSG